MQHLISASQQINCTDVTDIHLFNEVQ